VTWKKLSNKWAANIRYDGKKHYLGYFEDEEDAAKAYDIAARAHRGEKAQLNFPAQGESGLRESSKYRGVSWCKKSNKWKAQIKYDGKRQHLGVFENEENAANAYNLAAGAHHGEKAQLNLQVAVQAVVQQGAVQAEVQAEVQAVDAKALRAALKGRSHALRNHKPLLRCANYFVKHL
jgi:hypothetical protein